MLLIFQFRIFCLAVFSKNMKIKIFGTGMLPVLYICESLSVSFKSELGLRVYEKRVLKNIIWAKEGGSNRMMMKSE